MTNYELLYALAFWLTAIYTLFMGFMSLKTTKVMRAAIYLMLMLVGNAILYLILGAEFVFAMQITVYAGGILILFMFAVLLTGQEEQGINLDFIKEKYLQIFVFLPLVLTIINLIAQGIIFDPEAVIPKNSFLGNGTVVDLTKALANDFYTRFKFVLIIIGGVIMVSILGAIKIVLREEEL